MYDEAYYRNKGWIDAKENRWEPPSDPNLYAAYQAGYDAGRRGM